MQRLHEEDLSGHLLGQTLDMYQHICIPATLDVAKDRALSSPPHLLGHYRDGLFWPARFGRDTLKRFERRLGSLQAAGQLQQRPAPAEGNLIKRSWIEVVDALSLARDPSREPVDFFLDTAYTEKQRTNGCEGRNPDPPRNH